MTWVQLDASGNVTGIFANPQPDVAGVVEVADDDPRVIAAMGLPLPSAAVIAQSTTALQFIRARALIARGDTAGALAAMMTIIEGITP